jgi:hypothetical protein
MLPLPQYPIKGSDKSRCFSGLSLFFFPYIIPPSFNAHNPLNHWQDPAACQLEGRAHFQSYRYICYMSNLGPILTFSPFCYENSRGGLESGCADLLCPGRSGGSIEELVCILSYSAYSRKLCCRGMLQARQSFSIHFHPHLY